jgi:cytochrome c2
MEVTTMARETQVAVLLRIELLLKDMLLALTGAPVETRKSSPAGQKKLEDFYKVGAFDHKSGRTGEARCGLCKQVTQKEQSMIGPQGHLWLRHRKQMRAAGIKY